MSDRGVRHNLLPADPGGLGPRNRQLTRRDGLHQVVLAIAIGLATFAVFSPALRNELVSWDDWDNLTRNENYRGLDADRLEWMFTTTRAGHYQPLSWMSLAIDYLWGRAAFGDGLDPRSYHLTNLLLHAANAALAYLIALRLLSMTRQKAVPPGPSANVWDLHAAAALAAILFAWHPMRVESVVWATERRDVLSSFFLLLTVLCYISAPLDTKWRRWRWLGPALAAFALSLLSRSLAVVLPPILLLLDWYPLGRFDAAAKKTGPGRWTAVRAALLEKIPFFGLAAVFAGLAVHAQAVTRAAYSLEVYPLPPRLAQTCYGLCFYAAKSIVPLRLSPIYELQIPANPLEGRYVMSAAAVLILLLGLGWLPVRGGPRWPIVAAATYALFIVPVAGLVQSGKQEVADRYSYLPGMLLAMLAAAGALRIATAAGAGRVARSGVGISAVIVALSLAGLTVRQCSAWRDSETLWAQAIRAQPDSSIAHCELGTLLVHRKAYAEAMPLLYQAVELWPGNAQAHRLIWRAWAEQGPSHKADLIAALRTSVALVPEFTDAHFNLARLLEESGQSEEAIAEYQATLALDPTHVRAHTNLAVLLQEQGRMAEAMKHFQAAVTADPDNLSAQRGWGMLLHEQGRETEAVEALRAALRIDPNDTLSRKLLGEWTRGVGTATAPALGE